MVASTAAAEEQPIKLQEKYESVWQNHSNRASNLFHARRADANKALQVLGCCRLMTEAHSALIRSVKDLTEFVQQAYPDAANESAGSAPAAAASSSSSGAATGTAAAAASPAIAAADKKKGKKEKKERDPDMPKRPISAFFLFQNAVRQEMKQSLPDTASNADLQQALAAKWKELGAEAKKPYVDANEEAVRDYHVKMDAYNTSHGITPKPTAASKKTATATAAPAASAVVEESSPAEDEEEDDVAAASVLKNAALETPVSSKKRGRPSKKDSEAASSKKAKTPAKEIPAETPKAEKKKRERKKKSVE